MWFNISSFNRDSNVGRFDPGEAETDGVETLNHCEINVDVAEIGAGSWKLKSEQDAHEKMSGNGVFYFV